MQDSCLVPELIPIGCDVVRSSKHDWLVLYVCFLIYGALYVFLFRKATAFHLVSENTLQLIR